MTRVGHRGFILLLLLLLLNRRQIDLLEAETSESRAHAFNVVSASPPPYLRTHLGGGAGYYAVMMGMCP